MSLYPTLPVKLPISIIPRYRVDMIGPDDSNYIQALNRSPLGALHRITIEHQLLLSESNTLMQFHAANRGPWARFQMYDPRALTARLWPDIYLGAADGVTDTFALRAKSSANISITVAGIANTDWTLSAGTGTDDQDEIVFDPIPAAGAIKAELTGIRYFPFCIFLGEELDPREIERGIYSVMVNIQEVSR